MSFFYFNSVATLGTYLLTNMLAQSSIFHPLNCSVENQQNQNNNDSHPSEDNQMKTTLKRNGKSSARI